MFGVKICGITTVADGEAAAQAGADAIGLNFYAASRRYISSEVAERIARSLEGRMARVGVFVNAEADFVRQTIDRLALDYIQLHGDEPPEFLAQFDMTRVIRALRLGPGGIGPVLDYLRQCDALDFRPAAVLLDAFDSAQYGGTGETADWAAAAEYQRRGGPPLVLAGGLTAENVAAAIRTVQPQAVDVASGVESSPGQKDPAKVLAFVEAARVALQELSG